MQCRKQKQFFVAIKAYDKRLHTPTMLSPEEELNVMQGLSTCSNQHNVNSACGPNLYTG